MRGNVEKGREGSKEMECKEMGSKKMGFEGREEK